MIYCTRQKSRKSIFGFLWENLFEPSRHSPYLDKNNKTSPKFPFFPEFFKFFLLTPIGKYSIMDIGLMKMMTKR